VPGTSDAFVPLVQADAEIVSKTGSESSVLSNAALVAGNVRRIAYVRYRDVGEIVTVCSAAVPMCVAMCFGCFLCAFSCNK